MACQPPRGPLGARKRVHPLHTASSALRQAGPRCEPQHARRRAAAPRAPEDALRGCCLPLAAQLAVRRHGRVNELQEAPVVLGPTRSRLWEALAGLPLRGKQGGQQGWGR
jgi:hypothetical protein